MFGVLRGASCQLDDHAYQAWWGHICGLCLTLRDTHGQASRITTNYDAALLSVVYSAQVAAAPQLRSSVCALRGFRQLDVLASSDSGTQFAAAISLLMAAVRVEDQLLDAEGISKRFPRLARFVARRWDRQAAQQAQATGFDTAIIQELVHAQAAVEAQAKQSFTYYAAPTEAAVGAIFAHTAVLAERPANIEPLSEIGRMYGRIMLLLDAAQDYKDDQTAGRFNPLAEQHAERPWKQTAREIFEAAMDAIRAAWQQLELVQGALLQRLLLEILPQKGFQLLYPRHRSSCVRHAAPALAMLPVLAQSDWGQPPRDPHDPNRTRHMSEFPDDPNQPQQPYQYPQQGGYDPNQPQQPYQYPQQGGYDPNQPQQPYQYPQQGGYDPNNPYNYPQGGYQQQHPPQQPRRNGCLDILGAGTCFCCVDRHSRRHHSRHHRSSVCDCCDCCWCCDCDCGCGDCDVEICCCECNCCEGNCCECDCCDCD